MAFLSTHDTSFRQMFQGRTMKLKQFLNDTKKQLNNSDFCNSDVAWLHTMHTRCWSVDLDSFFLDCFWINLLNRLNHLNFMIDMINNIWIAINMKRIANTNTFRLNLTLTIFRYIQFSSFPHIKLTEHVVYTMCLL